MAIVLTVETGSASSIANSFASLGQTTGYWSSRGVNLSLTYTTEQIKAALVLGGQYLNTRYHWRGYQVARDQAMAWPRQIEMPQYPYYTNQIATGVTGPGGWEVGTTQIPLQVRNANIELASRFLTQTTIVADQERLTRREKVGEIEVEYEKGTTSEVKFPVVDHMLRGLVENTLGLQLYRR